MGVGADAKAVESVCDRKDAVRACVECDVVVVVM